MQALVLSSSPRRDGNSSALAVAAIEGLRAAGHQAEMIYVDDVVRGFLRDCRTCRSADGQCSIDDRYHVTFTEHFLPCDGFIAATPIYWYGMSAQLKSFFDRMFCYVAASHPTSASTKALMLNKRIGLLVSSEETFPTNSAGIVHQVQEYCRYTRSTFVGVVHGRGNARGDIARDPINPLAAARRFGQTFFSSHTSDYRLDDERPGRMWQE